MSYSAEPKLLTQMRGHPVYQLDSEWYYLDNDQLVSDEPDRACVKCFKIPVEIYGAGLVDPCFVLYERVFTDRGGTERQVFESSLPDDVSWACCGHGVEDGYIRWGNIFEMSTDAVLVADHYDDEAAADFYADPANRDTTGKTPHKRNPDVPS